jgi:site-specific DNA-cytosine methylase
MSYAESIRGIETMRALWTADVAQKVWSLIGGFGRIQQAEILFSVLREFKENGEPPNLPLASKEVRERFLRGLRRAALAACSSHQSGPGGQQPGEPSDSLQVVPQLFARDSKAAWPAYGWEDGIPRVASRIPARMDRLKCLGNAVVPQIAEMLGRAIMNFN